MTDGVELKNIWPDSLILIGPAELLYSHSEFYLGNFIQT